MKPGDRQLSLFQYADHRLFFSTYTTPDNHDAFAQIFTECPVTGADQTGWVYGYFGYSRQAGQAVSFLKTRSTECERKLTAMHRVPKYFAFYLGKDGIHTPFNGKIAHAYLWAGNGAFRDKDFLTFEPYIAGATSLSSKPFAYTEKKKQFE